MLGGIFYAFNCPVTEDVSYFCTAIMIKTKSIEVMSETFFEKLQFKDEKNILIQGLPSTIEKQFSKLSFAKNITPLLKTRKIDFLLVFAVNESQLNNILSDVLPSLNEEGKLWIAYPKKASKIASDLNRDCSWDKITGAGYEPVRQITIDHVWSALSFEKAEPVPEPATVASIKTPVFEGVDQKAKTVTPSEDFARELNRSRVASEFFNSLSYTDKQEYVTWIVSARKEETRNKRIEISVDKLLAGKKNPTEK
jgi:hypothetical protein